MSSYSYVQIYTKLLVTPTAALTAEEKTIKDQVEWEREFDDLRVLRELAMNSVTLPAQTTNQNRSAGRSMLESWFPQWMGWYSSSVGESNASNSPEAQQLEGEILQVLSDSAENNSVFKRDAVFGQFTFCLKSGTVKLCAMDHEINQM